MEGGDFHKQQGRCEEANPGWGVCLDISGCPLGYIYQGRNSLSHRVSFFLTFPIFKMNKGKSRLQRTPQKNEQGKRKISPTKKESESKRSRLTPKRGSSLNSVKKETSVFRRGLDFKEQEAEDTVGNSWARNWADDSSENKVENLLWVDKYKPTSLKTIIGQQGDQSCANKLLRWLQNWHKRPSEDKKHGDFPVSFIFVCVCHHVIAQLVAHT